MASELAQAPIQENPKAATKEKLHKISPETRAHIYQAAQTPAALAGAAASIGSAIPFVLMAKSIRSGDDTKYLKDFAWSTIKDKNLPVKRVNTDLGEFNAQYNPFTEEINTGLHGYPVMSHELGHAANAKTLGKPLAKGYVISRLLLGAFGSIPGIYMATSEDPETREHGIYAAGLPSLVTAEEGLASARGLINVGRRFGLREALKGVPIQSAALGTYAAGFSIAPILAAVMAKKYTERAQRDKPFQKEVKKMVEQGIFYTPPEKRSSVRDVVNGIRA